MSKVKERPNPDPPKTVVNLPHRKPPMFLCYTCGFRTLMRDEFIDHTRTAHP